MRTAEGGVNTDGGMDMTKYLSGSYYRLYTLHNVIIQYSAVSSFSLFFHCSVKKSAKKKRERERERERERDFITYILFDFLI